MILQIDDEIKIPAYAEMRADFHLDSWTAIKCFTLRALRCIDVPINEVKNVTDPNDEFSPPLISLNIPKKFRPLLILIWFVALYTWNVSTIWDSRVIYHNGVFIIAISGLLRGFEVFLSIVAIVLIVQLTKERTPPSQPSAGSGPNRN